MSVRWAADIAGLQLVVTSQRQTREWKLRGGRCVSHIETLQSVECVGRRVPVSERRKPVCVGLRGCAEEWKCSSSRDARLVICLRRGPVCSTITPISTLNSAQNHTFTAITCQTVGLTTHTELDSKATKHHRHLLSSAIAFRILSTVETSYTTDPQQIAVIVLRLQLSDL